MVRWTRSRWAGTDLYVVVRGWAIPPYKVGRRFGPGTPHEADMVKNKTEGERPALACGLAPARSEGLGSHGRCS
jgi:hypothetical protein